MTQPGRPTGQPRPNHRRIVGTAEQANQRQQHMGVPQPAHTA